MTTTNETSVRMVNMRLEIQIIPVSDVDRSKAFYERLGWRLDSDVAPFDGLRIVQFTPPGSPSSITFGTGLTAAAPGSAEGGLVVSDVMSAHDELAGRGIDSNQTGERGSGLGNYASDRLAVGRPTRVPELLAHLAGGQIFLLTGFQRVDRDPILSGLRRVSS